MESVKRRKILFLSQTEDYLEQIFRPLETDETAWTVLGPVDPFESFDKDLLSYNFDVILIYFESYPDCEQLNPELLQTYETVPILAVLPSSFAPEHFRKLLATNIFAEVIPCAPFDLDLLPDKLEKAIWQQELQTNLEKAEENLSRETRIKDRFLAQMSHEIRTPLNGIIGLSSLLEQTSLSKEQNNLLSGIQGSCNTLLMVVNDILEISKIKEGKIKLSRQTFNIRDCVEQCIEAFTAPASEKRLLLSNQINNSVPKFAVGDPFRIKQVLNNLISNAIKFTQQGCIWISVDAIQRQNKEYLRFRVKDTGIGIKPESMHALFSPYEQVALSDQVKGTGLGLSISRALVNAMGGSLTATSCPKAGSTFRFEVQTQYNNEKHKPRAYLQSKKVAIVGEHNLCLILIAKQLRSRGLTPSNFTSIEELEQKQSIFKPDLILLTDNQQQPIDFGKLHGTIRTIPSFAATPIIMIPNDTSKRMVAKDNKACLTPFPLKQSQFYAVIAQVLGLENHPQPILQAEQKNQTASESTKEPGALPRKRVLLVEDNEVNVQVASKMLIKLGHQAWVAKTGKEAQTLLKKQEFDFGLMDYDLPDMNGCSIMQWLRNQDSLNRDLPVLALTAHTMPEKQQACLDAGMCGIVTKPFRLDMLDHAINDLFSTKNEQPKDPQPTSKAASIHTSMGTLMDEGTLTQRAEGSEGEWHVVAKKAKLPTEKSQKQDDILQLERSARFPSLDLARLELLACLEDDEDALPVLKELLQNFCKVALGLLDESINLWTQKDRVLINLDKVQISAENIGALRAANYCKILAKNLYEIRVDEYDRTMSLIYKEVKNIEKELLLLEKFKDAA